MATQTIEFRAATGLTLTAKLFLPGNDAEVDSQNATEATNRKGTYSVSYTDVSAETYLLIAFSGTTPVASWWVDLTLTTATFQAYDTPQAIVKDIQTRLPAALVDGRMDASVGAMATGTLTAAALATDAAGEIADAVWDEVLTGATHNVATSAGRRLRTLADTVILKDGDTVAADNAGTINGSNGLGRIKLQPDVGTVCVGQAVRVTGQVRYIEAYDADTQYATVDSAWCTIPEVGDEYTIFNLRNALIQKINSAGSGTIAYPIAKLWEMLEDSTGWRFTEKALEEGPGGSVTIIPAASFAPARTDATNLIAYIGETISQVLTVYEADGTTPLDLSGKTLTVVFEDMETSDTGVVASASVTVSGDDNNIVTFAYPSAVTDEIGQYRYALRDEAAPKTVYSQGLLLVKAAANKDA